MTGNGGVRARVPSTQGLREPSTGDVLLEVDDLHVEFRSEGEVLHAVKGVSFAMRAGETLAIVGESGSGKTVTALAIMGLLDRAGQISGGDVRFAGRSLCELPDREYRKLRGGDLAMIFQDPLASLNPSFRVGHQIAEALLAHSFTRRRPALRRASELLDLVGIPRAGDRARDYPHQFSGGMRQRAMIAMAIANRPRLLIADEPTTALDVTIQAQVLDVLGVAQRETHAAMLLITHDLGVVAGIADRVLVMYAGRIVEEGTLDDIFDRPRHPYTIGLLRSVPRLDAERGTSLRTIPGTPPSLVALPPGCPFAPRCAYVVDYCRSARPPLEQVGDEAGHRAACFRAEEPLATADEP